MKIWGSYWHYQFNYIIGLAWYLHQPESHQLSLHKESEAGIQKTKTKKCVQKTRGGGLAGLPYHF